MTDFQLLYSSVLFLLIVLLIKFQQKTSLIFGAGLFFVVAMGWVTISQVFRNATNEGLSTIVLLILISFVLEKTHTLAKFTQFLFAKSERSSVIRTIGFSGITSALLNNTAVVATMISSIQTNDKVQSSRLLLPMCYAATLGGTMTLIGTSTNLVVNSMWIEQGHEAIGFFDFLPIGGVIFVLGSMVLFFTSQFIPETWVNKPIADNGPNDVRGRDAYSELSCSDSSSHTEPVSTPFMSDTTQKLTGWRESLVIGGFVCMIIGSVVTGSLFMMSLGLFTILVLTRCISFAEIRRHFPIGIWLIVVSALCLANAMQTVGLDTLIARFASNTLGQYSPVWALTGVMVFTIGITELLTNNAAAALMFPIAYSLAVGMGINPYPMMLSVCFAASCAFLSPFGYQTNLMVYNSGVYQLIDFAKVGGLITLVFVLTCIVMIPMVYPF